MEVCMKGNKFKLVVVITILAAMLILYYYSLSSERTTKKKSNDIKEKKEITKLIEKDLDNSYPKTPREVVRLYSRMIKCFYGGDYSDDELKLLAVQAQKLMDDELLKHNEFDEYYSNLTKDIDEYKKQGKIISTYILESSKDVEYKKLEDKQYAIVRCIYYTKQKKKTEKTNQEYVLRKDDNNNWKILYWNLFDDEDKENE